MKMKNGLVRMTYFDEDLKEEVLMVISKSGEKVIIPSSEIELKRGLNYFVGKLVDYVELENGMGSMSKAMPYKRQMVLEEFAKGEPIKGRIKSIKPWGAYISIKGVSCALRNCDFATDWTRVSDVYKEDDEISGLILGKISGKDVIYLEMEVKYENPCQIPISTFQEGKEVLGTIKNVKPFGCFVAVGNGGLPDVLCPIPQGIEVEEGMEVKCKLSTVDLYAEDRKFRGKIIRVVEAQTETMLSEGEEEMLFTLEPELCIE